MFFVLSLFSLFFKTKKTVFKKDKQTDPKSHAISIELQKIKMNSLPKINK